MLELGSWVVGVYTARRRGEPDRQYAVNLLEPAESNIAPAEKLTFKFKLISTTMEKSGAEARSVWKLLALAALGILVLEWYVYNRKTWI